MSIPLRVLVLEDSEADYELLLHELKSGGYEPESTRVQSAADLRTALAGKTWDIIISDYTMPQFNALDGLKIVRESGFDLPFIIISGAIGEDVAVEAMKAGAHDYLMKDYLARLCPAVRRELGEAEVRRQRRRGEDELRLLNRLYDLLSECNQALVRAQSRDKFLQDICRIAVDIGGFQLAWIGWPDPETRRLKPAAWAGKPGVTLERFRPSAEGDLRDFAESAVLEGKPSIYSELLAEPRRPSAQPTAAETGPYVSAAFPFRQAGKVGGALCLYANESDVFQEKETALLEEVAMDIAFGLDRLEGEARRKQAEQELQFQNILLTTQQETSLDGILVVDDKARILSWNRRFQEMWNIPREVMDSGSVERALQAVRDLLLEPEKFVERVTWLFLHPSERGEDEIALKDGRLFERYSAPMIGPDGRSLGRVLYYRDITERKRAEEAIRESEEQFRTLFESSRDAIMMLDQQGFTDCNQATLELFGCSSREEFIAKHPGGLSPPTQADGSDSFAAAQERIQTALKRGSLFFPWIYKRMDGTPFPAEVLLSQYYLKGEAKLQAVVRDITESVRIKEGLLKAAEEWRTTFDTISDPIMLTDLEHRIIRANRAFTQAVGRPFKEILRQRFYQVIDSQDHWPEYYPQPQTVAERKDHTVEIYHPIFGRFYSVTVTSLLDHAGALAGWVHLLHDITERKQMELQTLETEKLASLGVMAGGVAHEINNPLGGILGIAQLLLMDYPDHGMLTEDLKHIEGAALHCSEIVKNLLTFARKSGASTREPVEVPELVNQILKLIGHQFILYNILVRQEFGPDFPRLLLNRTQFQQVLINLLINAQQAMSKKGEVVIRGRTLPTREPVIEIEDQGGGIPAAIRDRIFDPFFTTKEEGKGTGLGLSVSYRIVQEHGGRIEVESEEGKGTRMRLVFPPELVTTEKSESRREA